MKLPNKLITFTWKLLHQALPIKEVLNHRGIHYDALYMLCNTHIETLNHIFLHCTFARAAWLGIGINTSFLMESNTNMDIWLSKLIESYEDSQINLETLSMIITTTLCLWFHRNQVIFEGN